METNSVQEEEKKVIDLVHTHLMKYFKINVLINSNSDGGYDFSISGNKEKLNSEKTDITAHSVILLLVDVLTSFTERNIKEIASNGKWNEFLRNKMPESYIGKEFLKKLINQAYEEMEKENKDEN